MGATSNAIIVNVSCGRRNWLQTKHNKPGRMTWDERGDPEGPLAGCKCGGLYMMAEAKMGDN